MMVASRPNARYPDAPQMAPKALLNPRIIAKSKQLVEGWEGCLSVPGLRGKVARPDWVELLYFDADGNEHRCHFEDFVARIFFHEYDHLIGRTWLDSVTSNQDIVTDQVYLQQLAG